MDSLIIRLEDVDALVFDFDGVLTDNGVYVDRRGDEWVRCNRADGLAFDVLRRLSVKAYILSTEKGPVVAARAHKLNIPVLQGVYDKTSVLQELVSRERYSLDKILYVGNDLNDYYAMKLCGFSACPADSHPKIKQISSVVLSTNGGKGVVRELLEEVLGLNFLEILY